MAEIVLIQGDPPRVVFRSHHAVMDGRGDVCWAEDVFRVLRGEDPLPTVTDVTENDLLNLGDSKRYPAQAHRYIAPTGKASGLEFGIVWRHATIKGRYPRLLNQVILLTAREAWKKGTGPVKFSIPLDMRNRREGLRSYGNLTSSLYLEITPDMTADDLEREITTRLKERYDGQLTWEDKILPHVPLCILRTALKAEARRNHRLGEYRLSGIISNMGRISPENFNGGGFFTDSYWAVPVCIDAVPYSMVLSGSGDAIELVLAMPRMMADGGRLEKLLQNTVEGLKPA